MISLFIAASLFLTEGMPLDMPRAQAFIVKDHGVYSLEDRFCRGDLWTSQTVLGRWMDAEGRIFTLSKLEYLPPAVETNSVVTRVEYATERVKAGGKKGRVVSSTELKSAIGALSPIEIAEEPRSSKQLPRGYKQVEYWHGTNMTAIVCAFRELEQKTWYLATWQLVESDNLYEQIRLFEDEFLVKEFPGLSEKVSSETLKKKNDSKAKGLSERELLRADATHSVRLYEGWHATDSSEFILLDHVPEIMGLIPTFTNELPRLRQRYAETMPSPIDGSNVLCVARVFANRSEYLEAVDESMAWSAAYWSPARRELVACLPKGGVTELMRTVRHEAFHQYLSYATSMIPASPWLNEGYAQYFEDEASVEWGEEYRLSLQDFDKLAELLPSLLRMDYSEFYAGTDEVRRLKYRLAWSIAVFLEKGAPKIRFEPFKSLKKDYITALLESRDMLKATEIVFRDSDFLKLFVTEWKRFWKN